MTCGVSTGFQSKRRLPTKMTRNTFKGKTTAIFSSQIISQYYTIVISETEKIRTLKALISTIGHVKKSRVAPRRKVFHGEHYLALQAQNSD